MPAMIINGAPTRSVRWYRGVRRRPVYVDCVVFRGVPLPLSRFNYMDFHRFFPNKFRRVENRLRQKLSKLAKRSRRIGGDILYAPDEVIFQEQIARIRTLRDRHLELSGQLEVCLDLRETYHRMWCCVRADLRDMEEQ